MTAQYSFKNHTLRCDWMGNFGFEKIDFSSVYDVTSNFDFKCYYYAENVLNAHAYLTKILF